MHSSLDAFPRPSVAVDVAVLTISAERRLSVLVLPENAKLPVRLPGTFVHEGETLADAVARALQQKVGVEALAPQQLRVFDAVDRDDRGRVLSVAHVDVVDAALLPPAAMTLPVDALPKLAFDHGEIVAYATEWLQAQYREEPDPARLLGDRFSMSELRAVHEVVLGEKLVPDTFRRQMLPALTPTGDLVNVGRGRPAEVFQRGL